MIEVMLAVSVVTAAPCIGITVLLHLWREKRTDARLRQIEGEYRRREEMLIRTLRLIAGAPTTGPIPRLHVAGERR